MMDGGSEVQAGTVEGRGFDQTKMALLYKPD
jgi:hypothetical protein